MTGGPLSEERRRGVVPTFNSAWREYAPVGLSLMVADVLVAFWLVWDMPPGVARLIAFDVAIGVLWLVTLLLWLAFAAKHVWWARRRVEEEAARLAARADMAWRQQHATDLLTCPGPCANRYGCMVGVCVIAATKRHAAALSPSTDEPETPHE